MRAAPAPEFTVPEDVSKIFSKFIAAEFAYFTPRGEPLCWPVSPYWYPDRGVLAVSTGLAYPNKADYPKLNPRVAFFFSDPTSSGLEGPASVLVQGEATVLDEDIQSNTDRYVRELRQKFAAARAGLNSVTVKLLDFYLPRLWVEITPIRITVIPPDGNQQVLGRPRSEQPAAPNSPANRVAGLKPSEREALFALAQRIPEAVVTSAGEDGFPVMLRTSVKPSRDGTLRLSEAPFDGPSCLTFHRHTLGGIRFQAYIVRGEVKRTASPVFFPKRIVGFFGNGAVFPFSVIPRVGALRRRLRRELAERGQPMPKLRVL